MIMENPRNAIEFTRRMDTLRSNDERDRLSAKAIQRHGWIEGVEHVSDADLRRMAGEQPVGS